MSQHPEVFGMHDNVDISRQLQETKQVLLCVCVCVCDVISCVPQLFDSVLLTQSQSGGGGGGKKTDDVLEEIAADVLTKVR